MNAEELIGTVLGTCTLQKLIGQGGMGAVFLAQQSRPKRQVAVKVLLPMTPLSRNQLAAFLERFRRETDAAASLEHPNITPVHEYGERDGLAYLVMPYVSGGTLRDEMEREGPLPLEKVVNYLDQVAAALDCAHDHGVIHRDIKPANILMTPEGRLLLTDFGLVKIIDEGRAPQIRLTGAGAPVGTPDYMAPEQVIGEEIDARADLYSLGVVLYQMITGTTPFQGETPMQIAAQHLQIPPPSPQMLRPDLPITSEQVMLRALAKRPSDRYMRAQDLANAFRMSLMGTGIQLGMNSSYTGSFGAVSGSFRTMTAPRIPVPGEPFDPMRQTGKANVFPPLANDDPFIRGGLSDDSGRMPTATNGSLSTPRGGGLLSRTGKFPQIGTGLLAAVDGSAMPPSTDSFRASGTLSPLTTRTLTGTLSAQGQQGNPATVKLTGPVKVVQMPIAGQPGRYVTGILPMLPQAQEELPIRKKPIKPWMKIVAVVVAILVILAGAAGTVLFVRSQPTTKATNTQITVNGTPDVKATAMAQATAAAQANIIVSDRLDRNINNWLTTPANIYAFKDGAYHITDRGDNGRATVLQSNSFTGQLGYSLTMQEVNGDDGSLNNSFGMIFRYSEQKKGNATVTTFYSFEVVNTKGGKYQFWKYDDSQGTAQGKAWNMLWQNNFGKEFNAGHGANASNTFKVFMQGNSFTFTVNGKVVKTVQDKSFQNGMVGMIVNLNGTEVAFKNLLLTRN